MTRSKTVEKNRGRHEEREVIVAPVGEWWPKAYLWYGVLSIICVIRTTLRQCQAGEHPVQEVHYYLCSLPPEDATAIGSVIRRHWDIENKCHHLLDVTYHEDHYQVRKTSPCSERSQPRQGCLSAFAPNSSFPFSITPMRKPCVPASSLNFLIEITQPKSTRALTQ